MWRTITDDDVYASANDAEVRALRTALLHSQPGDGDEAPPIPQADPLSTIIAQVTAHVRDAIRSCPDNRLSPQSDEVPSSLIPIVIDIILYRLGQRLSRTLTITDDRRDAWQSAQRHLRDIATCRFAVEHYDAPADTLAPPPSRGPSITAPHRTQTRADQDGI